MSLDFGGLFRDIVVLSYMLVLRIGVPLVITFLVGKWLQKKLEQQDKIVASATHCWDKRKTRDSRRAEQAALARPDLPCWLALQASGEGLTENCYNCSQYAVGKARQSPTHGARARDYITI